MQTITVKVPPRFVEDCLECECDVGDYAAGKLTATPAQIAELRNRAEYYASDGPDCAPSGIVTSARATLRALKSAGL